MKLKSIVGLREPNRSPKAISALLGNPLPSLKIHVVYTIKMFKEPIRSPKDLLGPTRSILYLVHRYPSSEKNLA